MAPFVISPFKKTPHPIRLYTHTRLISELRLFVEGRESRVMFRVEGNVSRVEGIFSAVKGTLLGALFY